MEREVMWISIDGQKIEHVRITKTKNNILADGIIIHLNSDNSIRIRYEIECDQQWQVRKVDLNMLDDSSRNLKLFSDGKGNWTNRDGKTIPELNNCMDLDIYYSPFTNTLAIRRLNLQADESKDINAAYINIPELTVISDPQRYTCLNRNANSALYLYESRDSDFKAELPVDSDMLVLDYPGFFKRHWFR